VLQAPLDQHERHPNGLPTDLPADITTVGDPGSPPPTSPRPVSAQLAAANQQLNQARQDLFTLHTAATPVPDDTLTAVEQRLAAATAARNQVLANEEAARIAAADRDEKAMRQIVGAGLGAIGIVVAAPAAGALLGIEGAAALAAAPELTTIGTLAGLGQATLALADGDTTGAGIQAAGAVAGPLAGPLVGKAAGLLPKGVTGPAVGAVAGELASVVDDAARITDEGATLVDDAINAADELKAAPQVAAEAAERAPARFFDAARATGEQKAGAQALKGRVSGVTNAPAEGIEGTCASSARCVGQVVRDPAAPVEVAPFDNDLAAVRAAQGIPEGQAVTLGDQLDFIANRFGATERYAGTTSQQIEQTLANAGPGTHGVIGLTFEGEEAGVAPMINVAREGDAIYLIEAGAPGSGPIVWPPSILDAADYLELVVLDRLP
jgi:hypothetical protein